MIQEIIPTTEVKVIIKIYDSPVMKDCECMAYLEGDKYKGIVVQGKSISDALKELAISLDAINRYRINSNE